MMLMMMLLMAVGKASKFVSLCYHFKFVKDYNESSTPMKESKHKVRKTAGDVIRWLSEDEKGNVYPGTFEQSASEKKQNKFFTAREWKLLIKDGFVVPNLPIYHYAPAECFRLTLDGHQEDRMKERMYLKDGAPRSVYGDSKTRTIVIPTEDGDDFEAIEFDATE